MKNSNWLWKPILSAFVAAVIFAYPIEAIALSESMASSRESSQIGASHSILVQPTAVPEMDTEAIYEGFYDAAQTLEQGIQSLKHIEEGPEDLIDGSLIACLSNCNATTNTRNNGTTMGAQLGIFGAIFGVMMFGLGHSYHHWKHADPVAKVMTVMMAVVLGNLLTTFYALMPREMLIVSTIVVFSMVMMSFMAPYGLDPKQNALYAEKTLAQAPKVKVTLNGYTKEVTLVPHNYQGETSGTVFRETGDSTGIFKGSLRDIVPSDMVKLLNAKNKESLEAQIWIPRTKEGGTVTAVPAERIVTIIPTKMLKMSPKQALELLKAGSKTNNEGTWKEVAKTLSPKGQRSGKPLNGSVLIIPSELYNESEVALWKDAAKKLGGESGQAMKSSVLVVSGGDA